jgi:ATP-dependent protease ClpP protease subunit
MPTGQTRPPQEVIVKVEATNPTNVKIKQENNEERVNRSMEVPNQEGHLSQLSFISNNRAFVKIFSGLSVSDVTRLWNDLVVLENNTKIRDVSLFINSPGGDAFSGLALADQIAMQRPVRFLWFMKPHSGSGRDVRPHRISALKTN